MISKVVIKGFRGFSNNQEAFFAIPDGETPGSGLTYIVGANNTGKTTIIESISMFNGYESPDISEGRRNNATGKRVHIEIWDQKTSLTEPTCLKIDTKPSGGCETVLKGNHEQYYIIPSRRTLSSSFGGGSQNKEQYIRNHQSLKQNRTPFMEGFESRLRDLDRSDNRIQFDKLLKEVLGDNIEWQLELRDGGDYYIKYQMNGNVHSAEGAGDGILSAFVICAGLHETNENETLIIDEPELSLHPSIQKRLRDILVEKSKQCQIIVSTHSPYILDWKSIICGAHVVRTSIKNGSVVINQLDNECVKQFKGQLNNLRQPHTFSNEASEAFFTDRLIVTEGQDDVILLSQAAKMLKINLGAEFFSWGAGGADNISKFLEMFQSLGYEKIFAIYDKDKKEKAEQTKANLECKGINYKIEILATEDIRDKSESKSGLFNEHYELKPKCKKYVQELLEKIADYFTVKV